MPAHVAIKRAGARYTRWLPARRDRQALKTAAANLVSLGVAYAVRLAAIPLSLTLLGAERYGLFLAVGSLVAWAGLAELGFAPGLVNVVAAASGRDDREAVRSCISTAFTLYWALAVVLGGVTLWVFRWPGLMRLLGVRDPVLAAEGRVLVLVCGLLFAGTTLTRVIPTACTALQHGYYGAWAHIVGNVLSLSLLATLYRSGRGSLPAYALVMGLPPLAAQIGLGLFYFGWRCPYLRPWLGYADRGSLQALWRVGWPLGLHQAANLAVLNSANILIANRLGPGAVPQYSVPYALYAVLVSVSWHIVSPYLPAYAEATVRGDWAWIRRRARQALGLTVVLLSLGGGVLALLGGEGIRLWTGGRVQPGMGLLIALASFSLAKACSNTNSVLLTGMGAVRFMASMYLEAGMLYAVSSWLLLPRLGVLAVPVAGAAAHLIDAGFGNWYAHRRIRKNSFSQPEHSVGALRKDEVA